MENKISLTQKAQLLDRILTFKEYSPFVLICDSIAQSANYLLREMEHRRENAKTEVVILTDLNFQTDLASCIQRYIKPGVSVVGVFHTDKELQPLKQGYEPDDLALLEYMATCIIRIEPSEEAQQRIADFPTTGVFDFSNNVFNKPIFRVSVEHRRKTGRASTGTFIVDAEKHSIQFVNPIKEKQEQELPENLTTFNLLLNDKQKRDKENTELPFFEAQKGPDSVGGAIVYQYEKDDDYDEEDPYEDPF